MKYFLILILPILLSALSLAQIENQITVDEETSKPMHIGVFDRNAFSDTNFLSCFNNEYENYNVDTFTINLITEISTK